MDEKRYLINGTPASSQDIIRLARKLDYDFASEIIASSSAAAAVLRELGYTINDNPDF